jgi:alkanesulfonate monooxygenase SsuD/methylene tetrahydromethanopterin reductase-like flavin-dependent oxidoreductase (luciferase family)
MRIAEDYSVLDNITRGRVDLIVAGGYAPSEFAMFDVPIKERPKRVTEAVKTLKAAFVGKPFEYRGRTVEVTPEPFRPGGSAVILGGASEGAARRAARIADGFVPSDPTWWKFYRDEMLKLGKADPGAAMPVGGSHVTVLTRDVETAWRVMAPYFLHDTNAYGAWKVAAGEDTRMTFMPMSIRCAPQTSITSLHQSRWSRSLGRRHIRWRHTTPSAVVCQLTLRGTASSSSRRICCQRSVKVAAHDTFCN